MIVLVKSKDKVLMLDLLNLTLTIKGKNEKITFEFDAQNFRLFLTMLCGVVNDGMGEDLPEAN